MKNNVSLQDKNSFNINTLAENFLEVEDLSQLLELNIQKYPKFLILGQGTNILFTTLKYKGLILKNNLKGRKLISENEDFVLLEIESGEIWNDVVFYCLSKGYFGLENLTSIPGSVGAACAQNIGAYGIEFKDFFYEVSTINLETKKVHNFKDCEFGYRDSMFKKDEFKNYFIKSVTFKLLKKPKLNLEYADLRNFSKDISPLELAKEIEKIRFKKLPDYKKYGNAGSFYKNPEISLEKYKELKNILKKEVFYSKGKISAAQLIEEAGWKKRESFKNCRVSEKHSLVLINLGNALGEDIYQLSQDIQKDIYEKFNILLIPEVQII